MYSIVMVVAMAGAPENPAFCCKGKANWGGDCFSSKSFCCKKDYSCAKNDCAPAAPVHVAPAPAPCASDCDTGYKSKGCCFFDKFGSKCGKGYTSSKCDTGYKSKGCCFFDKCNKGTSSKCETAPVAKCDTGCDTGSKSKGCCFFGKCCDKGSYETTSDCGSTVVPPAATAPVAPVAPKKEMPKTGPAPKVG